MKKLLIATRNKKKLTEIKKILSGLPLELVSLDDLNLTKETKETGENYQENAVLKAEEVGKKTSLLTLAEDSGLEIEALSLRPGIYSARYKEGTDKDRIDKILAELKDVPFAKREARFVSVVALYEPDKGEIHIFRGESRGMITFEALGQNGFGYDPIFYNFDLGTTNASVSSNEKNQVSHRSRSLVLAKQKLQQILETNV